MGRRPLALWTRFSREAKVRDEEFLEVLEVLGEG